MMEKRKNEKENEFVNKVVDHIRGANGSLVFSDHIGGDVY